MTTDYGRLPVSDDGDRVCCHECGGWYRDLGLHVRAHAMTPAEYREAWGLARTLSLASPVRQEERRRQAYRHALPAHGARQIERLQAEGRMGVNPGGTLRASTRARQRAVGRGHPAHATEAARHADRVGPRLDAAGPYPATVEQIAARLFGGDRARAAGWASEMTRAGHLRRERRATYARVGPASVQSAQPRP